MKFTIVNHRLRHSAAVALLGLAPLVHAQVVDTDVRVTSFKQIAAQGNRPAWSSQNLIAYDAPTAGNAGYFDVYTMQPDGTGVTCLTCGATALPAYNKGNPDWSPNAQYIAFQVQTTSYAAGSLGSQAATPGGGVGNDLFIMDAAGKNFYQITHNTPGVLHPRFSHDGTKIIWVQRVGGTTGVDDWTLMLGQFAVTNGVPAVTNIQSLPPCQSGVFCETGDFSLDDSTIFFTGVLDNQPFTGLDIYSYVISSQTLTNLTKSSSEWDELPRVLPNQNKVLWMSGGGNALGRDLKTDYWVMNYDGTNKVKLTYHNDQRGAMYWAIPGGSAGVSAAEAAWSPDATQLAVQLTPVETSALVGGSIYVESFEFASASLSSASYARPPIGIESIVSTFYSNLASGTDSSAGASLETDLSGTTATLTDAAGNAHAVSLFFVSPGQVNWLVPASTLPGPATLQITNAQNESVRDTVDIENVGPGLFSAASSGSGVALGYLLSYPAGSAAPTTQLVFSGSAGNFQTNPLTLGGKGSTNYLVLFGTGIRHFVNPVYTQIGSTALPAAFTGAQGSFFGLDQINVLVPLSFAGSGMQAVTVTVDGTISNMVQVQFQ